MSSKSRIARVSRVLLVGLVFAAPGCGSNDPPLAVTPERLVDAQKARAATLGGAPGIGSGKSKVPVRPQTAFTD